MFVKDIFQDTPLINYFEFFPNYEQPYYSHPEYGCSRYDAELIFRLRIARAATLQDLNACDVGVVPTHFQYKTFPLEYQSKLRTIFDGTATDLFYPDNSARFILPNGAELKYGQEIVTFCSRHLEPARGWDHFAYAIPNILATNPNAIILIVGEEGTSYSTPPPSGTYKRNLLAEISGKFDSTRVHFLGRISLDAFAKLLRISSVHVYMTVPFTLSWSLLEAMSSECLIVGSRSAPVMEVLEDGVNALLCNLSGDEIASTVNTALRLPDRGKSLRTSARQRVMQCYDLRDCIVEQIRLLASFCGTTIHINS